MLWQAETDFDTRVAGGYVNMAISHGSDLPVEVAALAHANRYRIQHFCLFVRTARVVAILVEVIRSPKWTGIFLRRSAFEDKPSAA